MTSQVIRNYYDAFNRRDYPAMLALLSPDVVHDVNQGAREVGKAKFEAFLARMDQAYRERLEELMVMEDDSGTRCAAEFVVDGTYLQADPGFPPAHGQRYRLPAGAFFELSAGLITRVTTYYNLEDWLNQVRSAP
ncbi:MAG TPA: ketosteroid isomerase-related protein [Polyangiales bacterium]|nr:ketosteroid isomerase-related protein [Polyangiales bacterium]